MYIFYRGAVERPEMVMGVDWAEESVHTVPLPTQLVILRISEVTIPPSHWSLICGLWLANVTHLMSNTKSSQSPSFYWFGLKYLEMHFLIFVKTDKNSPWAGLRRLVQLKVQELEWERGTRPAWVEENIYQINKMKMILGSDEVWSEF